METRRSRKVRAERQFQQRFREYLRNQCVEECPLCEQHGYIRVPYYELSCPNCQETGFRPLYKPWSVNVIGRVYPKGTIRSKHYDEPFNLNLSRAASPPMKRKKRANTSSERERENLVKSPEQRRRDDFVKGLRGRRCEEIITPKCREESFKTLGSNEKIRADIYTPSSARDRKNSFRSSSDSGRESAFFTTPNEKNRMNSKSSSDERKRHAISETKEVDCERFISKALLMANENRMATGQSSQGGNSGNESTFQFKRRRSFAEIENTGPRNLYDSYNFKRNQRDEDDESSIEID